MFTYIESDHDYLVNLKREYGLEELIHTHSDDFSKVKSLCDWAHHKLFYTPAGYESTLMDPDNIIREAKIKKIGFRCIEFAIVLNGLINSIGIVSRIVFLHKKAMEKLIGGATHAVVEAFLPSSGKWALFDAAYNQHVLLNNVPLNCYETLLNYKNVEASSYVSSIHKYLYYFESYYDNHVFIADHHVDSKKIMLVTGGEHEPRVYQRVHPLINVDVTFNPDNFYIIPTSYQSLRREYDYGKNIQTV
ncbi:transglutaminase domain-containing protein [Paenibacillaceae bacterium]|nr:transglutaminase domain-containing protein [Paenibacillaceae bacterium]